MAEIFASRFRLLRQIPSGAQSEIWVARDMDSENDERVVLKILKGNTDEILREFFTRETEALSQIKHPSVVKIKEWGFEEELNKYWISLEQIEGTTLEERIKTSGGLQDAAVGIILDIIDAVASAHSKGIIHRDLKPSNVMCQENGEITILDFGICKIQTLLQEGITVSGFGTPPYSAPEQLSQEDVDTKADVYSLGVMFFYMFTGRYPTKESLIDQIIESNLPDEYKKIINSMVAFNKNERYPSVLHVKREILKVYKLDMKLSTTYYLKLTQLFCNSCVSLGLIGYNTEKEAIEWVEKEFNSNTISIERSRDNGWVLYSSHHRISAILDSDAKGLKLKNIYFIPSVDLVKNKEWALDCNVTWRVLPNKSVIPKEFNVYPLLEQFDNWKKQQEVKRNKELEHKKVLAQWENVLRLQRRIFLEKDFSLGYKSWDISSDSSSIVVDLEDEIDNPQIYVDQPLLMNSIRTKRKIRIGMFAEVEGKKLTIALSRGANVDELDEFGEITLDNHQVSSSLKRQEDAIRAVRYGDAVNPELLYLIENPNINNISKEPIQINDFIHSDLDDAKKIAIKESLASNIYLIQGPPGTGKTKLISEIIGQIVRNNPDTKILLASQSNAAVDNALEAVSKLGDGSTLLRIGRKEKIGDKLTNYQLEETLIEWVKKTKEKSDGYSRILLNDNAEQLNTLAEHKASLRECFDLFDTYSVIDHELSRTRYRLFEEENSDNINESSVKTLTKKIAEMELERDTLFETFNYELSVIHEYLGLSYESKVYFNHEDLNISLQSLEKELERKLHGFNQLEQVELIRKEWLTRIGRGREFEAICASESQVVASTCLGVSNIPGVWSAEYDWVIIDEAGRATPPEILVPLVRGKRILLVGDHKQLPPVVDIELSKEDMQKYDLTKGILEKSLFEELFYKASADIKSVLNVQYRMHDGIGGLVSQVFYDGTIENGFSTNELNHTVEKWRDKSVVWASTSQNDERFEKTVGKSKQNQLEARLIVDYCERIENELQLKGINTTFSVGIISGYSEQKILLEQLINPKDRVKWKKLVIDIDNVDAFQGQEREIVFYSVVRSNKRRDIGFLRDYRRLNVAFSRARKLLVIVGDHEMALQANTYENTNPFAEVIRHIEKIDTKNCMLEVLKH